MMQNRTIILSDADHQRLRALVETARYDASLHEDYLDALEGGVEAGADRPAAGSA